MIEASEKRGERGKVAILRLWPRVSPKTVRDANPQIQETQLTPNGKNVKKNHILGIALSKH
jgi:hypothetical protein